MTETDSLFYMDHTAQKAHPEGEPRDVRTAIQRLDQPQAPAPITSAAALLTVIARAAADPAVDVSKMERLLAMQQQVMARENEEVYSRAMEAAQREMPQVPKDAINPQTNSRYARLETLNAAIVPIYTKHGFSLSYGTEDCPVAGSVRITCKVRHNGGHSEIHKLDLPLDILGPKGNQNKTNVHGYGSTLSYGRRYLSMLVFNVATGEDDDGNAAGRKDKESTTPLRNELWEVLKPVRGTVNSWKTARQWLIDETSLNPDVPIGEMGAEDLRLAIDKAKARLKELKIT